MKCSKIYPASLGLCHIYVLLWVWPIYELNTCGRHAKYLLIFNDFSRQNVIFPGQHQIPWLFKARLKFHDFSRLVWTMSMCYKLANHTLEIIATRLWAWSQRVHLFRHYMLQRGNCCSFISPNFKKMLQGKLFLSYTSKKNFVIKLYDVIIVR